MIDTVSESLKKVLKVAVEQVLTKHAPGQTIPATALLWDPPRNPEHGDIATNAAMQLAKPLKLNPAVLAEELAAIIKESPLLVRVTVAKPGFINAAYSPQALDRMLRAPLDQGDQYGRLHPLEDSNVLVEFVSANPTGPMHVGHARHAAVGDSLARVLAAAGHTVYREFYINDAGNQVRTLGRSFRARILQLLGDPIALPPDGYPGDYLFWYAWDYLCTEGVGVKSPVQEDELFGGADAERFRTTPKDAVAAEDSGGVEFLEPADAAPLADADSGEAGGSGAGAAAAESASEAARRKREAAQAAWLERARARIAAEVGGAAKLAALREKIGARTAEHFEETAKLRLLSMIQSTLADLRVAFDQYSSEAALYQRNATGETLDALKAAGATYEKDGALWLKSTEKGDDKDRVLIKKDGTYTYLLPDLAYHRDKFQRSIPGQRPDSNSRTPHLLVNLFGSDHDGYPPRLRAGLGFLGISPERLQVVILRLVFLAKGGQRLDMGKRSGNFVSARDLLDDVGCDVLRFFLLQRSANSEINFDLDLAREQSDRNPVFKIQYSHARVCSLLKKAEEKGMAWRGYAPGDIEHLTAPEERELLREIAKFPEMIEKSARMLEPHHIPTYLLGLSDLFNSYWSIAKTDPAYRMIVAEQPDRTQARLTLAAAFRTTIANGLHLMGVNAPERMDREDSAESAAV